MANTDARYRIDVEPGPEPGVLKTAKIGKGKAGPGRPKGMPNKTTAAVKDMILQALDKAHKDGGVGYLKQQAQDNPTAFLTLVGKVIPLQVGGDPDNPLEMNIRQIALVGRRA